MKNINQKFVLNTQLFVLESVTDIYFCDISFQSVWCNKAHNTMIGSKST